MKTPSFWSSNRLLIVLWAIVLIALANAVIDWSAQLDSSASDTFRWPGFFIFFAIAAFTTGHAYYTYTRPKR
jgi:hypothetical protein